MSRAQTFRPKIAALAVAVALPAVWLTAGTAPTGAAAVAPCGNVVTGFNLQSTTAFASNSKLKQYRATVDFPGTTGFRDQTATVLLGVYPAGSRPAMVNPAIGDRATVGSLKSQKPTALAAINGDFFTTQTIRGKAVEFSRGPMIKDGVILRSDKKPDKVVGVDSSGQPFDGTVGARGSASIVGGPKASLAAVNWHTVQSGGFTLYTDKWSRSTASPRPAGVGEWVLNGNNKIVEIRTSATNASKRGAIVASNTKVLAFPAALESTAAAGVAGQKVRLRVNQKTDSGVTLTTAVGRGVTLVKRGVAAPLGCDAYDHSASARPRTVIGWTRKGAWRSITVPGTRIDGTSRTGGMGLANVGAVAKKMGLRFAYELDGGASVTLHTRSSSSVWSRRDLVGVTGGTYERPVDNGLAFLAP